MLQQAAWREDQLDAISRHLAPGELIVSYAWGYVDPLEHITGLKPASLEWSRMVLTNVNLLMLNFAASLVKTGVFSKKAVTSLEIKHTTQVPLSRISSVSFNSDRPASTEHYLLRQRVPSATDVVRIKILTTGGNMQLASPYSDAQLIARNLQMAISGEALVRQTDTVAEAIERLAALREDGLLTDEEFERAKQGFVGKSIEFAESSASLIRQLHNLMQAGALTEGEYRIKKWDILSRNG